MPATTPPPAVPAAPDARTARLRVQVELAARALAPTSPVETFVAMNPLAGWEDRPFEDAVAEAGAALGATGWLPEADFRDRLASGTIAETHLRAALVRRVPALAARPPVSIGGRTVGAVDVALADFRHGEPAPAPVRVPVTLAQWWDHQRGTDWTARLDAYVASWCAAYLDDGEAAWALPGRDQGLWSAWRAAAGSDPALRRLAGRRVRTRVEALATGPEAAILDVLDALAVPPDQWGTLLRAELLRLPGWAALLRRRAERTGADDLLALVALHLSLEALVLASRPEYGEIRALVAHPLVPVPPGPSPTERAEVVLAHLGLPGSDAEADHAGRAAVAAVLAQVPVSERMAVWQEAAEATARERLLARLDASAHDAAVAVPSDPVAQVVVCIDPRSEGLRRHLEATGRVATIGFAGFFGLPVRVSHLGSEQHVASCPVLLAPRAEVVEEPVDPASGARVWAGRHAEVGAEEAFHTAKVAPGAPFALAEASGWLLGPAAAGRTAAPRAWDRLRRWAHRRVVPETATTWDFDRHDGDPRRGLSLDDQIAAARTALRVMGLTSGFAPLVVLAGHGGRAVNTPLRASLDCGACGGNAGGPNAAVLAGILNRAEVRAGLAEAGIVVPDGTWFVAGVHETTTDTVTLRDTHLVPASHAAALATLESCLSAAGAALRAERCRWLPEAPAAAAEDPAAAERHVRTRAADWAQVLPEWGLVGNFAFVAAPREVTAGVDLARRVFLHSYDPEADADGSALETILTGPLVVAHGINAQYYFSTVDPEHFGAGPKPLQNVVGGVGVLSGAAGDVRLGLSAESVSWQGRPVHEPLRLLAVVEAPIARLEMLLERHPVLARIVGNGWVTLVARDSRREPWMVRSREGTWETATPAPGTVGVVAPVGVA